MTDPRSSHTDHDALLIAAHAAGDVARSDQQNAARLVAGCPDCARLHADLIALAHATARLPVPRRPREFTLSPDDAARARRSGWRKLLGVLAGPRFAAARPVGAAFATLGVAGLLLASLPGIPLAASTSGAGGLEPLSYEAASSPADHDARDRLGVVEQQGAQMTDAPRAAQAPGAGEPDDGRTGAASGGADITGEVPAAADGTVARRTPDTAVAILSGSFLIVGVVLVGLRWTAGRLGD
jgi:hypothetical protein